MASSVTWSKQDFARIVGITALFIITFGGLSWTLNALDESNRKEHALKAEEYRLSLTDEQRDEVARTVEQLTATTRGSLIVFKQEEGEKKDLAARVAMVTIDRIDRDNACLTAKTPHEQAELICVVDHERKVLQIEQVIVNGDDPRYAPAAWAYLNKPY